MIILLWSLRSFVAHHVLFDLEFVAAKVDEQSVLEPCGFEVAEDLSNMLVGHRPDRFQFDDQSTIDQQVGEVITHDAPIFIVDRHRMLLRHLQPDLPQPMCERVLVNLLQMPVSVIDMNGVGSFTNQITKLFDALHAVLHSIRPF